MCASLGEASRKQARQFQFVPWKNPEIWSENQADKYYNQLIQNCQELSENKIYGRNYSEIGSDIFGFKSGMHILFYKILNNNQIEIIRILHSNMDLKTRIKE